MKTLAELADQDRSIRAAEFSRLVSQHGPKQPGRTSTAPKEDGWPRTGNKLSRRAAVGAVGTHVDQSILGLL